MSSGIIPNDDIKQTYERLISEHDKPLDFNDTIKKDIMVSQKFQETFCCSNPVYIQQIDTIKATRPSVVVDNTVGAYLYGCFQPELAVEIACTPACTTGLKNPDLVKCDIAAYEKKDDKFVKLNDIKSEDANVFIAKDQIIKEADRAVLKEDGVKVITTYKQDGTTINYILGESYDITQPVQSPPPEGVSTTTTTSYGWLWILIIIAIVVGILIAIFFIR